MDYSLSDNDLKQFERAVELALLAEAQGNLPIGSVIALDGRIIAEGKNSIWVPGYNPRRHAEIEAISCVPPRLWDHARNMTLYTTLEPCMMCATTILHHKIGRVLFATIDPYGGSGCALGHLPPFYEEQLASVQWLGPVLPEACDPLYDRVRQAIDDHLRRI